MEVILKHISEITIGECEDYFMQGFDMEVDKHTKIVMFVRSDNVKGYLNGSEVSSFHEEYFDKAKDNNVFKGC